MKDASHAPGLSPNVGAAPRPVLSVFDGAMIVVGIVIGAGIFRTPSMVAGVTGSVEWMLTRVGFGRCAYADRRPLLCRTGKHISQCRWRLPLSDARIRA